MKLMEFKKFKSKEYITVNVETISVLYEHPFSFFEETGPKKGTVLIIGNVEYCVEGSFKEVEQKIFDRFWS